MNRVRVQDDIRCHPYCGRLRPNMCAAVVDFEPGTTDAPVLRQVVVEVGAQLDERGASGDRAPCEVAVLGDEQPFVVFVLLDRDWTVEGVDVYERKGQTQSATLVPPPSTQPLWVTLKPWRGQCRISRVAACRSAQSGFGASIVGGGPLRTSRATVNARDHCPARKKSLALPRPLSVKSAVASV